MTGPWRFVGPTEALLQVAIYVSLCCLRSFVCYEKTWRAALLEDSDWTLAFCSLSPVHSCKTEAPRCLAEVFCTVAFVVRPVFMSSLRGNEAASIATWLKQNLQV